MGDLNLIPVPGSEPASEFSLNHILKEGRIIDNRRVVGDTKVTLEAVLKALAKDSVALKCAVGYVYLEGLSLIVDKLKAMNEIKILMGATTTRLTKQELLRA